MMNRGRASARQTRSTPAAANPDPTTSRAASATVAPPSRSATPAGRGAAATTTRATRAAAPVGRFRPKVIRRDEAERDTLARQEEQKANERAAEERRALRGRGRGRSRRSRGDAMGRGGMRGMSATASGPFSSGIAAGGRSGGWFGGGGGGGGAGSGFRAAGPSRGLRAEKGGFHQRGDRGNRETRINADRLHVMTPDEELDSDDEAMMLALSTKTSSVLPMGIFRREHKDEGIVVATTAELEAADHAAAAAGEDSMFVDDDSTLDRPIPHQPPEEGVWETGERKFVSIKREPDDSTMDLDPNLGTSEETKIPIITKKTAPIDPEDKIIQSDLHMLANELGGVTITDGDGETKTEDPANKDGRMYLFQFPPLLPPLKQTAAPSERSKVKGEPREDFNMLDAPAATGETAQVDLTEEDASENKDEDDPQNKNGFMSSLLSSGGMIGQLRVRRSGKVELDWGGRILEMGPATGMNFLTTAVIMEENDEQPAAGVIGGDSIGMGKIMGKFVLAPYWGEEEEWEVTEEDLVVDEALQAKHDARIYHKNLK